MRGWEAWAVSQSLPAPVRRFQWLLIVRLQPLQTLILPLRRQLLKTRFSPQPPLKILNIPNNIFFELYTLNRHNAAELHMRTNELFFMQNYGVAFTKDSICSTLVSEDTVVLSILPSPASSIVFISVTLKVRYLMLSSVFD